MLTHTNKRLDNKLREIFLLFEVLLGKLHLINNNFPAKFK